MRLHVSPKNGVPLYLQIVNQINHLVASGRLQAGDEVPPIRTMAQQLLINPNTVARAYRELEVAGVLTKRQGAGTYVSETGSPLARKERLRILADRVDGLLAESQQLNVSLVDLTKLIHEREEAFRKGEGNSNDD